MNKFSFHHVALSVKDLNSSLLFYAKLGYKEVLRWQAEDKLLEISHLKLADSILELFCYSIPINPNKRNDKELDLIGIKHFGIKVPSIKEFYQFAIEQGLNVETEIKDGRTGIKYFFLRDPDDVFVEIVEDNRNL